MVGEAERKLNARKQQQQQQLQLRKVGTGSGQRKREPGKSDNEKRNLVARLAQAAPVSDEVVDRDEDHRIRRANGEAASPFAEMVTGGCGGSKQHRRSRGSHTSVQTYNPEAEAARPQLAPTKASTTAEAAEASAGATREGAGDGGNSSSVTDLSEEEEAAALRLLSSVILKVP